MRLRGLAPDDHRTVSEALRPLPGDRVLCLVAAGDTPLNLLIHSPAEVVAVGHTLPRLHLARLKATAAGLLTLGDLQLFLGVRGPGRGPAMERLELYRFLRKHLDPEACDFWDDHLGVIRRGLVRPSPLPHYLQADTHALIRTRTGRIHFVHCGVREALRASGPGFDCVALSDLRLTRDQVAGLLTDLVTATRPNGRVLLLSRRRRLPVPRPLPRALTPQPAMQHRLRHAGRAVVVLRRREFA
jgi:S-adenosylmethionine:diacylglycerol 3-amino-3-carboxypropyl transferase